jgi:HlyD family secretion protein
MCAIETAVVRLIAACLAAVLLAGCGDGEQGAVGTLEWDRVELVAEVSEPVVEVAQVEGALLAPGDLILQLDPGRAEARLAEVRATRDEAAARLAELERGPRGERISEGRAHLRGAEAELEARNRELSRLVRLAENRLASSEAVDEARRQRDAAEAERDSARSSLDELESGTTSEELEQARQVLARSEAALRRAALDLARLSIRAPLPARLDDLPFEQGEQPAAGAVVAVLLVGDKPHAKVFVPEHLRIHVRPGSRALVHVDGLEEPLEGTVRKVLSDPTFTPYFALTEYDRGRLSYPAEITLLGDVAELPGGVPVRASFPDIASQD